LARQGLFDVLGLKLRDPLERFRTERYGFDLMVSLLGQGYRKVRTPGV